MQVLNTKVIIFGYSCALAQRVCSLQLLWRPKERHRNLNYRTTFCQFS